MSILSVNVGDQFHSVVMKTRVEVLKIWFEFNQLHKRWETSVTWATETRTGELGEDSGKGHDFVKKLLDGAYERVNDTDKISFSVMTTQTSSSTPAGLVPPITTTARQQQWENDFRSNAERYGLSPSDLGRKISLGKNRPKNHTIIGAKPRNYKMPILIRGKRGGIYKITAERAKAGL